MTYSMQEVNQALQEAGPGATLNDVLAGLPGRNVTPQRKLILAIDYDGTLDNAPYPEVGQLALWAKVVMQQLAKEGHTLIVWTCRENQPLQDALNFLRSQQVPFHYANQNDPWMVEAWGNDSRKIFANLYFDDRAHLGTDVSWLDFYQHVQREAAKSE